MLEVRDKARNDLPILFSKLQDIARNTCQASCYFSVTKAETMR